MKNNKYDGRASIESDYTKQEEKQKETKIFLEKIKLKMKKLNKELEELDKQIEKARIELIRSLQ